MFRMHGPTWPTKMNDYAGNYTEGFGVLMERDRGLKGYRPVDIIDGLSTTFFVSEKRLNVAQAALQKTFGDDGGIFGGFGVNTARSAYNEGPAKDFNGNVGGYIPPPSLPMCQGYSLDTPSNFGGPHTGGLNVG